MRRVVGLLVFVVATMVLGARAVGAQQGYTDVAWERLIVPVPPDGTWTVDTRNTPVWGVPVLADAGISYPPAPHVESPSGPYFTILQFSGTLEQWIDLERRNGIAGSNGVDEASVRTVVVAGLPAITFDRTDPHFGDPRAFYVLKLDENRLLRIYTESRAIDKFRRVIDGVRFDPAAALLPRIYVPAVTTGEQP